MAGNPQISVSTETTTTMRMPFIVTVTGYAPGGKLVPVQLYVDPRELRTTAAFLRTCAEDGERDGEVDRTMNLPGLPE